MNDIISQLHMNYLRPSSTVSSDDAITCVSATPTSSINTLNEFLPHRNICKQYVSGHVPVAAGREGGRPPRVALCRGRHL